MEAQRTTSPKKPLGSLAHLPPLIAIFALTLVAYSNSFRVPFLFDDLSEILDNEHLRSLSLWRQLHGWNPTRFVTYFSFALNHRFGQYEVFGYHLVNLLVHLGNALWVYALVRAILRTPAMERSSVAARSRELAFVCAALFATHPLQTQAVTYVVQRLASLATFFYLAAVLLFAAFRRLEFNQAPGGRKWAFYGLALFSGLLAMKTKESSFTLPLAICLYDLMFYPPPRRGRLRYLLAVLALLALIPASLARGDGALVSRLQAASTLDSPLSRTEYLFSELPVVASYLRLLLLPVGQNLDHAAPAYTSLLHPVVLLSGALLATLLSLALWAWRRAARRPEADPALRLIAFGGLWFFLALAVESSVIPIADLMFEHRVYLPSFGFFLCFAAGVWFLAERIWQGHSRFSLLSFGALSALVLSAATYQRNAVWKDELSLWSDAVAKSPGKARPHQYLALALARRGELDQALEHYAIAVGLEPEYAEPHVNYGVALFKKGEIDQAIEQFKQAILLRPDFAEAHYNLGIAYGRKGWTQLAYEEMAKGMKR